jgi:hypothetical protein
MFITLQQLYNSSFTALMTKLENEHILLKWVGDSHFLILD